MNGQSLSQENKERLAALHSCSGIFKERNDCTVRALSVATDINYGVIHTIARAAGRQNRKGFNFEKILARAARYGIHSRKVTLQNRVRLSTFARKHPRGRYVILCAGHVSPLVDGVYIDCNTILLNRLVKAYWTIN
jgi:hypothetical protein